MRVTSTISPMRKQCFRQLWWWKGLADSALRGSPLRLRKSEALFVPRTIRSVSIGSIYASLAYNKKSQLTGAFAVHTEIAGCLSISAFRGNWPQVRAAPALEVGFYGGQQAVGWISWT